MLMFTLTEDGAERQSDGRHFPHWGSNSNDTQPPPASGSSYSLLPRYGSAGAWRFSLADLASGRAAVLDAQLRHDVLSGSVVVLELDGLFRSGSAERRALEVVHKLQRASRASKNSTHHCTVSFSTAHTLCVYTCLPYVEMCVYVRGSWI